MHKDQITLTETVKRISRNPPIWQCTVLTIVCFNIFYKHSFLFININKGVERNASTRFVICISLDSQRINDKQNSYYILQYNFMAFSRNTKRRSLRIERIYRNPQFPLRSSLVSFMLSNCTIVGSRVTKTLERLCRKYHAVNFAMSFRDYLRIEYYSVLKIV